MVKEFDLACTRIKYKNRYLCNDDDNILDSDWHL
jgi:hypothetical protein